GGRARAGPPARAPAACSFRPASRGSGRPRSRAQGRRPGPRSRARGGRPRRGRRARPSSRARPRGGGDLGASSGPHCRRSKAISRGEALSIPPGKRSAGARSLTPPRADARVGRDPGSALKNIAPKLEDAVYERNFADINPRLTPTAALSEAARCLFCYDAPCIRACPTAIDIPSFIKKIATGNLVGSARTILEANVLGHSCARVCPVEVLCEGACVLNQEHKRPVPI